MMAVYALEKWLLAPALAVGLWLFAASLRYSSLVGKFFDEWDEWQSKNDNFSEESYEYIGTTEINGFEELASEQPDLILLRILRAIRLHLTERKAAYLSLQAAMRHISFLDYLCCSWSIPKPWSPRGPRTPADFRALVSQAATSLAKLKDNSDSISFLRDVAKRRLLANFKKTIAV